MKLTAAFSILSLSLLAGAFAQDRVGKPITLKSAPIRVTTAEIMRVTAVLGPQKWYETKRNEVEVDRENLPGAPGAPPVSSWPFGEKVDLGREANPLAKIIPGKGGINTPLFSLGLSFNGPTYPAGGGPVPPDSTGDVSPSTVLIASNGQIKSYTKSGAAGALSTTDSSFFASVRGGSGLSDPRVVFDRISQRWFVEEITTSLADGNNRILLAVSDSENITASTVWNYYSFVQNVGGGANGLADYATLAVDANAIYIGTNVFAGGSSFIGCDVFVIRKSSVLSGGPMVVTPFHTITPASGAGIYTPWGCTNDDPTATSGLIVGVDNAAFNLIQTRRVNNPGGTPTLSAAVSITVPTTRFPIAMPISTSAATTGSVDSLDDRMFYTRIYKNQTTGVRSLWTAHNIGVDASGVAGSSNNRTASRWYEIGDPFGTPTLVQAGTAYDNAASNPRFCTIPSIAMNLQGHAFAGFSLGNVANSPGLGGAFRLSGSTLGTIGNPTSLVSGANYYNIQSGTAFGKRWGDYSTTVVDPADGMTIWTFQEIVSANNQWGVRAAKMMAPAPTATMSATNITQGATQNITIDGTGFFDPDVSYPNHLSINAGAGVTVNSFTWTPTQIIANVTVAESAALGARNVTVTNPDGQSITVTSGITVTQLVKNVAGSLTLSNYLGSSANLPFTIELRNATTNAVIQTVNLSGLGAGNTFAFTTTQLSGSYKLRVKAGKRFLGVVNNINLTLSGASGLSYTLTNGDVDGNNTVNNTDFTLLRAVWGSTGNGANDGADLNGDGTVGNLDFAILRANLGQSGQ